MAVFDDIKQARTDRPWQKDNNTALSHIFTMYISPADQPGDKSKVVTARVSENVVFNISNTYGTLFQSQTDSPFGRLFQLTTGRSLAIQEASKQIWQGSTTGTFSFELEFIARNDPRTDVIDQIKALYKLASPSKGKSETGGVLSNTFGGAGEAVESALLKPPGLINLDIPNVLSLTNFHIQEVSFTQIMKLMMSESSKTALPSSARGSITIAPEYMFLRDDIDFVFLGGTSGGGGAL